MLLPHKHEGISMRNPTQSIPNAIFNIGTLHAIRMEAKRERAEALAIETQRLARDTLARVERAHRILDLLEAADDQD